MNMYTAEEAFDIATRKGQPEQTHIDMPFNGGWRLQGDFWEQGGYDDEERVWCSVLWDIVPGDDAEGSAVDWDNPAYIFSGNILVGGYEYEEQNTPSAR